MTYLALFFLIFKTFFKIAVFIVGGGLAMIPVLKDEFVTKHKLLKDEDIVDMVAMTQIIPGLIAVNSAIFIGFKLLGIIGSLIAVIGLLIPSIVIITLIAMFLPLDSIQNQHYLFAFSCVRACVTGVFLNTALNLGQKLLTTKTNILFMVCFLIALFCGIHPGILILISIPLGIASFLLVQKRKKQND